MKSNLGIFEEVDRLWSESFPDGNHYCQSPKCQNHLKKVSIETPKAYQSFGTTKAGSQRYRCKLCKKFVTVAKATRWQQQPEKNLILFKLLLNKSPMRRIAEVTGVNIATIYHRVDFFYEQCLAFTAFIEKDLATLPIERLYLSVDRQDYAVNWALKEDRKNTVFQAVASTDNETQYVFGLHLNFDPNSNPNEIEEEFKLNGDINLAPPFRQHARHWVKDDYEKAIASATKRVAGTAGLTGTIADNYANATNRDDIEDDDYMTNDIMLPYNGTQIHSEYTLYGHFFYLKKLLGNVGKFRFFLDQDSGMRAACLAAFQAEIEARKADAFYVSINKEMKVDSRLTAKKTSKSEFAKYRLAYLSMHPHIKKLTDEDGMKIKLWMIKDQIKQMQGIGKWRDRWLMHPLPSMSEPEKAVCYLTDYQHDPNLAYTDDHLAWLYYKASMHGVDNVFMQIRRRISLLERAIHSSANAGRVWNGYAPYNPHMITKMLTIFRTFHNFIHASEKDGKTPAQRLGLVTKKFTHSDVINFA